MLTEKTKDPGKSECTGNEQMDKSPDVERLRAEIAALRLQNARLQADCDQLKQLYDNAPLGYQSLDEDGCLLSVNQTWLDLLGYRPDEVIGRRFADFLHPEWQDHFREGFSRFKVTGEVLGVEYMMRCKDGRFLLVSFDGKIGSNSGGGFHQTHCIFRDITAHRAEEDRREAEHRLLRICHLSADLRELIGSLVAFFQELTNCQAVGIRLRQGEDYPYYESCGFPPHFISAENFLCQRMPGGGVVRDSAGNAVPECMCGNVLHGCFDPSQPFFTEGGSFWTNSTTGLLAGTTEADRQARTRSRCNGEGYESVALIPFRLGNEVCGLLQLNDKISGRFTPELISQLEKLAAYASLSIAKHLADASRQESEERYRSLFENSPDAIFLTKPDGEVDSANPAACALFGMSEKEIREVGRNSLMVPGDPRNGAAIAERELHGKVTKAQLSFVKKNGEQFLGEVDSVILPGEPPRSFVIVQDITERKRAEEALCQSQAVLHAIYESAPLMIGMVELDDDKIIAVHGNTRVAEFFGMTPEQLPGLASAQISPAAEIDELWLRSYRQCQESNAVVKFEYLHPTADGDFWISASVAPVPFTESGLPRFSFIAEDITERRLAEKALRESEKRYSFLLSLSDALRSLSDPAAIQATVTAKAMDYLGVDRCCYCEIEDDTAIIRQDASIGDLPSVAGVYPLSTLPIHKSLIEAGRPLVVTDINTTASVDEKLRQFCISLDVISSVDVPIIKGGKAVGIFCITKSSPHEWTDTDVELVKEIAERTWAAVDRVRVEKVKERLLSQVIAQRERLQAILSSMDEEVWISDAAGNLTQLNSAAREAYGIRADGRPVLEVFDDLEILEPDGTPRLPENTPLLRAQKGETVKGEEIVRHLKSGELRYRRFTSSPIRDGYGNITGTVTIGKDITEEKRAEQESKKREARYRLLHDSLRDGFGQVNMDGRIVDCNGIYCEMLGYSAEELRTLTYTEITPECWHESEAIIVRDVITKGYADIYEKEYRRKDGTVFPVELSTLLIRDDKGQPAGIWAIVRDITERKQAEKALRESERRLQQALLVSRSFTFEWNAGSDKVVRSESCANILLLTGNDIAHDTGRCFFQKIHPDDHWRFEQILQNLTPAENAYTIEYRFVRSDGTVVILEEVGQAFFDAEGNMERIVGVSTDVSERKRIEEQLRALNEELEQRVETRTRALQESQRQTLHAEKLSAIGRLAASIAHEFNNPLQGVMTILKSFQKTLVLEEQEKVFLDLAYSESERMKNLIRNLQDFNRPSSGRKVFMDVNATIDSLILLSKSDLKRKGIAIVRHYTKTLPQVLAIPDQIKQVIINLLQNAADACTGSNGVITISTFQEDKEVAVAIQDNGIGIAADKLQQIFQPFYTTKPEVKGTGLGLSICHGIVQNHQGEIRVESEPGKGSTFTVLLPICAGSM